MFLDKVAISSPKLSHTAIHIKDLRSSIMQFSGLFIAVCLKITLYKKKKNNLFGFLKKAHGQTFLLKKMKTIKLDTRPWKTSWISWNEVSNFLKNLMRKKSWNCSGIFIIITSSNPVYQGFKYLLKNTFLKRNKDIVLK